MLSPKSALPALAIVVTLIGGSNCPAQSTSAKEADAALRKAVGFFRSKVSIEGGYLWKYSSDLSMREGEREAESTTAWVQPPGTPSVGDAFLQAYERTGDAYLLDAARQTAHALVKGQLMSGGWDYRIEVSPAARRRYAYRVDGNKRGRRNTTTFDDNTTQAALQFLMRFDRVTKFRDKPTHDAVQYGLAALLKAQYPNGAWPQRYDTFPDSKKFPVKKASYPESWSRKYPKRRYLNYYTFNDNAIADVIDTLFLAAEIYRDARYRNAAEKAGDFIILAQMPEPQPAWAQQYDADMHPAWARKFEPPSVTGGESQGVMRTLLSLYRRTGKKKYLEPLPRALAYLKKSQLPGGRLARFYELNTNKPLYFVKDTYVLTYDDSNMPTHYGFKVGSKLSRIERDYKRLLQTDPAKLNPPARKPTYRMSRGLQADAARVVKALDRRGAWLETGTLRRSRRNQPIISTRTFIRNAQGRGGPRDGERG
eukprot:g5250.t1